MLPVDLAIVSTDYPFDLLTALRLADADNLTIALAREQKYASNSVEHNVIRIRQGQSLPIEVLQSTQALLQARREYLRTINDYNTSQFTL